ncbi:MAG: DNA topoisomerase 3 [Lachnospiraceae bacterium]|nr:DNA topoisomerase 3 [Lachnospiraceae bacterium]MBQ9199050.1 DNA topoisomerase 3 [Lachnospiraceae bacterium]
MKLVISEKPSVAKSIADVIGATNRKDGYFEGNGFIVSWCVGHLIEPAFPQEYNAIYEKWEYDSLPIIPDKWKYHIKEETKEQYEVLRNLMHSDDIDSVVCATDAGREGELIFRLVYNQAGCNKPMERLWISSMEDEAIRFGMQNLKQGNEYDNLYKAALARQEADWLVGINVTRLFTVLYGGKTLKVGRVQTPTLAMIVDREQEIINFKKKQYFITHIIVNGIDAISERIEVKADADNLSDICEKSKAVVKTVVTENKKLSPPKLYDLTSLQRDANKIFGFTAKQTLDYTQSLYEKKLVTYPRTDSMYLTDDMEDSFNNVIGSILDTIPFVPDIVFNPNTKAVMNSKKVSDHHAIIPTIEIKNYNLVNLSDEEKKILFLDAARVLSATSKEQTYSLDKIVFECAGNDFMAKGKNILDEGWKLFENAMKNYFKASEKEPNDDVITEQVIPELSEGETIDKVEAKITEHFTKPPQRYTEATLLSAMEKAGADEMVNDVERKGLGTPATRADVIEKLVKDGFIIRDKKVLIPTDSGQNLITILPDKIKSAKLTSEWENKLSLIAKGEAFYEEFMTDIKNMVEELVGTYHSVSDEDKKMFTDVEVLGRCPNCGAYVVKGKYGAYCKDKCGMMFGKLMGITPTDAQIKAILAGKRVLIKKIKKKNGEGTYDAYLTPEQIVDCNYTKKDGTEVCGKQFKFKIEFVQKKK